MDYDYDHLGSGIEKFRETLVPLVMKAESDMGYTDTDAWPSWLEEAGELAEAVFCFPEAHAVSVIRRVTQAMDLIRRVRLLDDKVVDYNNRELMALSLEKEVHTECEVAERYYGITVPTEVRYPTNPSPLPTP